MRTTRTRFSNTRRLTWGAVLSVAVASLVNVPLTPAHAGVSLVTQMSNPSPDPYGRAGSVDNPIFGLPPVNPPTLPPLPGPDYLTTLLPNQGGSAAVQVTVDSPVAAGSLAWAVVNGPDAPFGGVVGPNPLNDQFGIPITVPVEAGGHCGTITQGANGANPQPIAPYTTIDATHPLCAVGQGHLPLIEGYGGVDTVEVWAEKNGDTVRDANEPFVTIHVTYTNTPGAVSVSGPSTAMQSDTCTPFSVAAADASDFLVTPTDTGGRPVPVQHLGVIVTQPTPNGQAPANHLQFCGQRPQTMTDPTIPGSAVPPSTQTALYGAVTTGNRGEAAPFGVSTDALYPITVFTFWDDNNDGKFTCTSGLFGHCETHTSQTFNVVKGGADGVTKLVLALDNPNGYTGSPSSGVITLTNAAGQPSAGVTPVVAVAGANPQSIPVSPSDANGNVPFSYVPTQAGVDTVTAFVNQSTGGTPGMDPSEPQSTGQFTISPTPQNAALTFTVQGTLAGGQVAVNAGTANAGDAQHAIDPLSQPTETFTAKVVDTAAANHPPRQGVRVQFAIPSTGGRVSGGSPGSTSANDATLSAPSAVTDSNGIASVTLTNPNPVAGDAFRVIASIGGTASQNSSWLLYQASTVASTTDPTGNKLGTAFPTTKGIVSVSPPYVTTKVGTNQQFTATVRDQFGTPKSGITTFFTVVAGRNSGTPSKSGVTDPNGVVSTSMADTSSAPLSSGNRDTVLVAADADGNPNTNGDQSTATSFRYYTAGDPLAVAAEGGIGTPTQQFASTSPYAPKTSDNNGSTAIDVTHPIANQTPTNIFFAARSSDNVALYGRTISVTSSGVGSLVDPATNQALTNPVVATIDGNGFANVKVLSTATGVETLIGTIDNVTSTVNLTWTNVGTQRIVTLTPGAVTSSPHGSVTLTATATDVYGNGVPGAPITFSVTGPATFSDGSKSLTSATGSDGTLIARVVSGDTGPSTVTATMTGSEVGKSAGDPNSDSPAGVSSASSTVTVSGTNAADSGRTSLAFSPSANGVVGSTITAVGIVRDASGAAIAGRHVSFTVTGVTTGSDNVVSDSNGRVSFPITSSRTGSGTVTMKVLDSSGNPEVTKTGTVTFGDFYPAPTLSQQNSAGTVLLTVHVDPHYAGYTAYFFRRSGITGYVRPVGTAQINGAGNGYRQFETARGGILAIYSKLVGASDIANPYSNDVRFKVQ